MNKTVLVILGILAIVALLFSGLLPLPGQKDNPSALTQPSAPGTSPEPTPPKGPRTDGGTHSGGPDGRFAGDPVLIRL